MTGDNAGWVYNWDYSVALGYLYSTADNQWFSYPLASDRTGRDGRGDHTDDVPGYRGFRYKDPRNPVPVPRVYDNEATGRPLPTATSIAP